jgi:putative hemin transport protein
MSDAALDSPAELSPQALRLAREENPKSRARDLAEHLGVTEAQLVAALVDGSEVVRLTCDMDRLFPLVRALGPVLALTRNAHCVHERDGTYLDYHPGAHAAMILGPDIDLRMFPRHWVHAFAVTQGGRRSVQVFDAAGDAVHKIHLREGSDVAAFDALVAALRAEDQSDVIHTEPRQPTEAPRANPDKRDALRTEWEAMTDTHQFLRLTSKLKMNRLGAYRIAGADKAQPLATDAVSAALREAAAAQGVPLMIFVGNIGCIQIHGGPIHRVEPMGPWMNVLDPAFNLHLRADKVAEVYLVRKPTKHGMAVSIEAFDAEGMIILQIFGQRTPGNEQSATTGASGPLPGTERWVALAEGLVRADGV